MPRLESGENSFCIRRPARLEHLRELIVPVVDFASKYLEDEKKFQLELVLEEALVNIFSYAYPEGEGEVEVNGRIEDSRLVMTIEDQGVPFSGEEVPSPEPDKDILERKIGGLGVHLIRNLADRVNYRREGNTNMLVLTFTASLTESDDDRH